MKNKYNEEIKKIKLSETDFDSERNQIENYAAETAKTKQRSFKPLAFAASIAVIVAFAFCFPQVRTFANSIRERIVFSFSDGTKGELTIGEDFTQLSFAVYDEEENFFEEKEGRLYFSFNGDDITDSVNENGWFRFEINRENGKSVLLIGGKEGSYGWCELVFDKDGKYITNRMNVPADNNGECDEWLEKAMHSEGVPCGNPELDKELE
ncbi:MAG: hypothetical protein IJK60_00405 [Clostridia bacterium]|nr:hypothetical protein [Clostridia bacterium]